MVGTRNGAVRLVAVETPMQARPIRAAALSKVGEVAVLAAESVRVTRSLAEAQAGTAASTQLAAAALVVLAEALVRRGQA